MKRLIVTLALLTGCASEPLPLEPDVATLHEEIETLHEMLREFEERFEAMDEKHVTEWYELDDKVEAYTDRNKVYVQVMERDLLRRVKALEQDVISIQNMLSR